MPAFELVQLPAFGTTAFELIQKPPLWTTAIEMFKSRRSRRRQLTSSKAAVHVAGFCLNQKPALVLPASRCSFGIILKRILILFFFFKITVFPYKTLKQAQPRGRRNAYGIQQRSTLPVISHFSLQQRSLSLSLTGLLI